MACPLCQHPAPRIIERPYLSSDGLTLATRINTDWDVDEGICDRCFDAIVETVAESAKPPKVRPSKVRFSEYFRYTLTRREQGQWAPVNVPLGKHQRAEGTTIV